MKGKQKSMILKRIGSRMKGLVALLMAMVLVVGAVPGMEAKATVNESYYLISNHANYTWGSVSSEYPVYFGKGQVTQLETTFGPDGVSGLFGGYYTSTNQYIKIDDNTKTWADYKTDELNKIDEFMEGDSTLFDVTSDTTLYYGAPEFGNISSGSIVVVLDGIEKDEVFGQNNYKTVDLPVGKYTLKFEKLDGRKNVFLLDTVKEPTDEGQIDTETDTEGNVPKPKANMSKEFAMSLLNDDEKGLVAQGASVKLSFRITDSNIPAGDKQQIEGKLPEYNNAKIGLFFDASLWLQVAQNAARKVSNFNKQKLTAEFEVPQSLLPGNGIKRTFMLFNVHDNVAKLLAKTTEKTIVTELDGLSTFAIAYQDEPINSFMSGLKLKWKKDGLGVKWDKTEGASKYEVYATYCGKKFSKKATKKTSSNKVTIKKIKKKDIDLTKNVKVYVKAYDSEGKEIGETITAHFVGKGNPKFTNPKNIKLSTKSITVDKGQSSKIKASVKREDSKKKLLKEGHDAKLRYASSDISVATVDKNGNVTGVEPGNCTVYVYAVSGIAKKVSVTVK